jgi:GT2 family glycosyltransferase
MSVIIVNWNGKHYLEDCLSSLRRQTFRDFETIMVDNGSTDESVEYVRQQFPEVRIIAEETNLGFTGGNISGFALATGTFIVLLNNDTEADPGWLQAIHNAGVEFPSAGSFASKMMYFDDRKRIENCGFEVDVAGTTVELGRDELDGPDWHCALKVFGACGGAVAYRRSMLERIGFLDPDFFMIYEDVDLSFRAQLFGYDCVYVPQAIVYHRYRSTLRKQPATQVFYSQRNIDFVYLKNLPAGLILRSAPRRILYELGAAIYFLRIGSGPAFFRAKFDVFKRLPSVLRKRKAIQRNKALNASQLRALMHGPALTSKLKKFATLREASPKMLSGSDSVHSNR